MRAVDRVIAWVGLALLLVLHVDAWRPHRVVLLFGWFPEELAYRLGWIALALLYLLFFTSRVWREEDR